MPNHAVMVHGELGIPECEIVATSGICLSGLSALKYAYLSVASGDSNNSVATGSEISSNIMLARNFDAEHEDKVNQLEKRPEIAFEKDFLRWMLSDGAGAMRLSPEPNVDTLSLRIEWIDILSYAHKLEACMYGGAEKVEGGKLKGWTLYNAEERANKSVFALKQDVKLLDENIVKLTVEQALTTIAKKRGITPADIDFFLPHYSSEYFREKLYSGLKNIDFEVPYEKWFTNLHQKGNTGSASIYIILEELFHSGKLKLGQKLLCYVPESGRFSSGFMLLEVV
jgi:3-oxoacyl-[acyl-carrier-protein] synthase-3